MKDKHGQDVDVVLGYDSASYYGEQFHLHGPLWFMCRKHATLTLLEVVDLSHPVYNAVPGRYVNRIGNAQFTIEGKTYRTEVNDGPNNTLHGGTNNWSYRTWDVIGVKRDSITFAIFDIEGSSQGFPGRVDAKVRYSVSGSRWHIEMEASSPEAKTRM